LRLTALLSAVCCLLAAVPCGAVATPSAEAAADDDPLPIRRILLRPEQLVEELQRVRRGVLLQMPRSEFDTLTRRASAAVRAAQSPPALVETHYRARLDGDALLGSARWRVLASGPTPTLLPVEPLQLAVRKALWADDRAAILGDLDPRQKAHGAELLIDRPGDQTLSLEWSARGIPEPGGVRFDLRMPPSGVATLDLDLPPGYEPSCQHEGCLVTGPTPAAAPDRRAWRLLFGGASQLELVVRASSESAPQPLVMVRQQNVQELSPGQAVCDFSLDLDVRHGGVRELRLEYDPALRPADVAVRNLARWQILEGDEDTPNQIAVEFSEPFLGGVLTLRGIGPVPTNRPWLSPWVRVAGGVSRGEQVVIRVPSELAYEDWKPGSFRLKDVAALADRAVAWTLLGGAVRAAPTRPSARFKLRGAEYQVRERLWWQIGPADETLTAQCSFDVRPGPVFQVPWALPADWMVQHVDATPADSLAGWSVAPPIVNGGPATLTVEFLRPLVPAATTQLQMTLTRRRTGGAANRPASLTAPDVRPVAAVSREGSLAVKVASEYQASWGLGDDARSVNRPAAATSSPDETTPAPWAPDTADFVVDLRPYGNSGSLFLRPRPSRYRAQGRTSLTVVGRRARLTHRLILEPLSGATDTIVVRTGAEVNFASNWRVASGNNRVRGVQQVDVASAVARAALGMVSPWAAVTPALDSNRGGETLLALRLERPMTEPVELQGDVDLFLPPLGKAARVANGIAALSVAEILPSLPLVAAARAAGDWPLAVALVSVPAAAGGTSAVSIDLTAAAGVGFRSGGMQELATPQTSTHWRQFIAGPGPASLWLVPDDEPAGGAVTAATLRTDTTEVDRLLHQLNVRLQNWFAGQIRIGLPNDAIVQRVLIDGAIAPVKAPEQSAEGLELSIPLRGSPDIGLQVVFATPQSPWRVAARLHTPAVRVPGASRVRQVWRFPPEITPIGHVPTWTHLTPADDTLPSALPNSGDGRSGDEGAAVWVVRGRAVMAIGLVLAAAVVIAIALAGSRSRQFSIGVAAATGLLVIWLPAALRPMACWPFVAALVSVVWVWGPIRGRGLSTTPGPRSERLIASTLRHDVVIGVAIVAWLATTGRAAAPAPATVFLVPDPDGAVSTVLVPVELAEQLRELEHSGVATIDGARVITARYIGEVDGPLVRLRGSLEVHSFFEGPTTLSLPLTGVVLRDARLDGVPAYPRLAGERYAVVIRSRGRHVLDLDLQAPVGGTAEDKEIRFGGPEAVQSALQLDLPAGARSPFAVARRGAQSVKEVGGRARLDADLGRVGAVHVRWQTAAAADAASATTVVNEAYLWDISGGGAALHGSLRYSITGGSVTSLGIELPKDLFVAAVAARPLDPPVSTAAAGWLRHWHTAPHDRGGRLTLDFSTPVTGNWQITLSLVPRVLWPTNVTLSFPAADGKKTAPAAYAYRARDLAVSLTRTTGVAPLAEELFLRDHWLSAQVEADPPRPTRAFLRSGGGQPTLRVTVASVVPEVASVEMWNWRVGPEFAEVRTDSRVSAHTGNLLLLEWEVPPTVRVVDLRGPDVANWTRTGGRLQVWLRRPVTETAVQWTGTVGHARPGNAAPAASTVTKLDLPTIRPVAMSFRGTVTVAAAQGVALSPMLATHLRPDDAAAGGVQTWTYATESPSYQASFQLRPATSDREFRVTTVAALRDGLFHADTTIETGKAPAARETLLVSVRPAGGFQYRLSATGARVREVAAVADGRAWTVERHQGSTGSSQPPGIELSAMAPASGAGEWVLPHIDVEVSGGRPVTLKRTVVLDNAMAAVEIQGLQATGKPNSWAVMEDGWVLRVRPAASVRQAEVQTSAAEVMRRDDGRWCIRLNCQMAGAPGTTLRWIWPRPVQVLSARVDEGRLVPSTRQTRELEFALDDRPGFRSIVLEWIPDSPLPWEPQRQMPRLLGNGGAIDVPVRHLRWTTTTSSSVTPLWILPLSRTALLIGLMAGGVWWLRRQVDDAWPERLVLLGGVGWAAAGGWYWLLPITAGAILRGAFVLRAARRRRQATTPVSALSS
jgi:hypothetical protein